MPTFAVEGVAWSAQRIPTAFNVGFLDRSRYFSIQVAPQLPSRGWVDPVPDTYFSENLVGPGIKPGTSGSVTRNSAVDHRGGRFPYVWLIKHHIINKYGGVEV
jgi:hypothetical protein